MSEEVQILVGDRVLFPAGRGGRGKSEGRIVNIVEGMATIDTKNGRRVSRRLVKLEKVQASDEAAPSV